MTEDDFEKFSEVVLGFAELKGKQLSAPAIELYFRALHDWTLEDFRAAAGELLRRCEFMPTPKDFEDLRRAGRMAAPEAWALVLDRARGHNELVGDFDNPTLQAALRAIGGLQAVQMSQIDKTPFLERRFAEHFETLEDRGEVRAAIPQIASPQPIRALLERTRGSA